MGKYKHVLSCNEKYHVPKYECGRISMFPFLLREKISVPNPAMGLNLLWKNITVPNPTIGEY